MQFPFIQESLIQLLFIIKMPFFHYYLLSNILLTDDQGIVINQLYVITKIVILNLFVL